MTLSNLKSLELPIQLAMFENCLGPSALKVYNLLEFSQEEEKSIATILQKMEMAVIGELNVTYERYVFNSRCQHPEETVDSFVTDLRDLAKSCNFCACMHDSLIKDRIVMGTINKETQKKLLSTKNLSLQTCIDICRAAEATSKQLQAMHVKSEVHKVNRAPAKGRSSKPSRGPPDHTRRPATSQQKECKFCGKYHEMLKSKCPAYGQTCSRCKRKNHFALKCPRTSSRTLNAVDQESEDSELKFISSINAVSSTEGHIYVEILICGKPVRMQIDCGASVNVLPKRHITEEVPLKPTKTLLQMWNKATVKPLGEAKVPIQNPATGNKYLGKFIIVDDEHGFTPLLGNRVSQKMNLITVNTEHFKRVSAVSMPPVDRVNMFPEIFREDEIGKFSGTVHLTVDENITPEVTSDRRIPEALKNPLKDELDKMVRQKVIIPVEQSTDWVSRLVVARKKSGGLRVCIDPQALNKALKREKYQLPVLDDILPDLAKAKVFTTVDLKAGYWHVMLDEQSSLLTTFSTPFGRYRFLRLPFGCNVSSEIFQRKLKEAVGDLPGVHCIADDILMYGVGDTEEEANKDHDKRLIALLQRCKETGIQLSKAKMKLRQKSVPFYGHLITSEGLKPDPSKVAAIEKMPPPQDVAGIQRLNGFANYLAKFLPELSKTMEPIRQLVATGVSWNWGPTQEKAFDKLKELVKEAPCLQYYDASLPLVVQCDTSEKGLGAALLQSDQPISYASRALSEVEQRYAQLEKEMLAIVYALERFDQYTYARQVIVHSDHKPLESILKKPLHKAPKRLQGMMMRLQRFEIKVIYKPGKELFLADTLSRAFPEYMEGESLHNDLEQVSSITYLPISQERLHEIRSATQADDTMQVLKSVILQGWPDDKADLPSQVMPYFHYHDELTIQDGLIFRGERVCIPLGLRQVMKEKIHSSHIGIEGCLRRARECIFWPNMNADVKDYIQRCEVCKAFPTSNQKESMIPHEIPDRPWSKIGVDLFTLQGIDYVVTVDYTSNFWEVDKLDSTVSKAVIKKLKPHFARYGIPDQVITDNGPQFTSEQFARFAHTYGFEHITTSPHHSQANGQAESAVKTAKKIMKRALLAKSDIYLAMLDHRNTPTQGLNTSPAQVLMNRRTKTQLPTTASLLQPRTVYNHQQKLRPKAKQKKYFDRNAKDLPPLEEGDVVRMKPFQKGQHRWNEGIITRRLDERSYQVETEEGEYRRNRVHLKATIQKPATSETTSAHPMPVTAQTPPAPRKLPAVPTPRKSPVKSEGPHLPQEKPQIPDAHSEPIPDEKSRKQTPARRSSRQTKLPARFHDMELY